MSFSRKQDIINETSWVRIRSRRDPAFWAPLLLTVLIITPLFMWAHGYKTEFLDTINTNTLSDPKIYNQLILHIRLIVWPFSIILMALSALNYRCFKAGTREGRLPPSGWWSLGAWRAIVGPRVNKIALFGYAVSLLLFIRDWFGYCRGIFSFTSGKGLVRWR